MGIRSLVSVGLLIIPIAVTVGVLVGLDLYRTATGQSPLFVDNKVVTTTYCQKAYGITPRSTGEQYTLNPNQWGWTHGDPGNLCMNVTAYNNGSYPTKQSAPEFSVTWQYPQGPPTQPVHAFPNIKLDSTVLPVQIGSIQNVNVDIHWTYGVGDQAAVSTDSAALSGVSLNANVAIDMFLDDNGGNSQDTTKAKYEVMVWLADYGSATQPIGLSAGAVATQTINGTVFNLYYGPNSLGQIVLTWLASSAQETFVGDIAPLLSAVTGLTTVSGPSTSTNLGYIGLGSEALYSTSNVTFHVPSLAIEVVN